MQARDESQTDASMQTHASDPGTMTATAGIAT
jgi:hypothetical protein